jgi:hypothetical protein
MTRSAQETPADPAHLALILDVDGVVSPVGGRTAWGDDAVAGELFGPVLVSPTLCQRLDQLGQRPGVYAAWLTSWSAPMRAAMHPFPGRTWPQIPTPPDNLANKPGLAWWKWDALAHWLYDRPIRRLAWCDDHLTDAHPTGRPPEPRHGLRPAVPHRRSDREPVCPAEITANLSVRGINALLVAPRTDVGLTPAQVEQLERFLAGP